MTTDDLDPQKAKAESEQRFQEATGRWPMIKALTEPLFAARQDNHFAERMRAAMAPKGRRA